nr:hypothetical protein [Tanacetum cinerariifolium]
MDKGVANTVKDYKRKHDDDEDPLAGPNQGNNFKRRRTKDLELSNKPSTTKETPKGNAPSKGSKTSKSATTKEPVKEPTTNVGMDDAFNIAANNPLPLNGRPCHITVATNYFFNNDLECLKSFDLERTYTTPITKKKAARYEIKGIKDMFLTLWSPTKVGFDKDALKGTKHWGDKRKLWCRSELGVECYQKKLNIIAPQKTFPEIEFKELYTPSYKPPGEWSRRNWTTTDNIRSELMVELIDKQMRERRIIKNLERLVGAQELEMDYKLMT